MSLDDSTGDPISAVVKKLTPRLLATLLIVLLLALTLVISFALFRGGSVNLREMTFSTPSEQNQTIASLQASKGECEAKLKEASQQANELIDRPTKEALSQCEARYSQAIALEELAQIIGAESSREEVLAKLRKLAKTDRNYVQLKQNYFFKLFLLETRIPQYGKSISTRYDNGNRRDTYELIQEILLELGFYEGNIDGSQKSTMNAVIVFQEAYNKRLLQGVNPDDAANSVEILRPLGHVGYRTLEAFRSWYRENAV